MAIEDIDKMTAPLSRREETQMAMSAPDPMSEGIMQLAGGFSGDDIIQSAMIWMAGLPGSDGNPIGMNEVIRQLNVGETDINGLVNAYMDAKVDSN